MEGEWLQQQNGDRSKTHTNSDVLECLITISLNNTKIEKILPAYRNWLIKWIFFEIANVLLDPPDEISITNCLKYSLDVCKGMGDWNPIMRHYPKEWI